jgi:hypothetical protein
MPKIKGLWFNLGAVLLAAVIVFVVIQIRQSRQGVERGVFFTEEGFRPTPREDLPLPFPEEAEVKSAPFDEGEIAVDRLESATGEKGAESGASAMKEVLAPLRPISLKAQRWKRFRSRLTSIRRRGRNLSP